MKVYKPIHSGLVIAFDIVFNIVLVACTSVAFGVCIWVGSTYQERPLWQSACYLPLLIMGLRVSWMWLGNQWRLYVRKERCTAYFQTQNTLAIRVPNTPAIYLKRRDFRTYLPSSNAFLLRSDKRIKLPGITTGDDAALSCEEEIIAYWWPEVDTSKIRDNHRRKLPFYGVFGAGTIGSLLAIVLPNWYELGPEKFYFILAGMGWAYVVFTAVNRLLLRAYNQFQFPLPPNLENISRQ